MDAQELPAPQGDRLISATQKAQVTYDKPPVHPPGFQEHPVYKKAPGIFDQNVNRWDLSNGENFLGRVRDAGLRITDVKFLDWKERDQQGAASTLGAQAYIFDPEKNEVRVLDHHGQVHAIKVEQYGLDGPGRASPDKSVRMRIPSDPEREDISCTFSLVAEALSPEEIRFHAWDLATRVRYLREEIRSGSSSPGNLEELQMKVAQLATLFDAPRDKAKLGFEVKDTAPANNSAGFMSCRRIVEIRNPNAEPDAEGTHVISLLHPDQNRANLTDMGTSRILPPAQGNL